jgi:hypothetical protein
MMIERQTKMKSELMLVATLLALGCTRKPDPMVAEVAALKAQVAQLQMAVKLQDAWNVKQIEQLDRTAELTDLLVKQWLKAQAKPKPASGWVDCWTTNGHRNCVDAQGNSSSRNF